MLSTLGVMLTVGSVLLCLQTIAMLWLWSRVRRAPPRSTPASRATSAEPAPPQWESRLAELQADVVSLSSSFEKVTKAVTRQNQRDVMRERRSGQGASEAPPKGTPKGELLRHYGMAGKVGPAFTRAQMEMEMNGERSN
jgi:hypothetical protein